MTTGATTPRATDTGGTLAGQIALVAGGGLRNAAAVRALVDAGATVVLQAQGDDELAGAAGFTGCSILDQPVEKFGDADALVAAVVAEHGGIDILLTPVAPMTSAGILDLDAATWEHDVRRTAKRSAGLARAVSHQLVAQGRGGRILSFGSSAAFSSPGTAQAAAHAAAISLNNALHVALADHGVNANCVLLDPETGDGPLLGALVGHLAGKASADIAGRLLHCSGREVGLYTMPLIIESAHVMLRFGDTVDADTVGELLQPLLTVGRPS